MTASEDLMDWNSRWRIANGVVWCRTCHARQPEVERPAAFAHSPGCGRAQQRCDPWDELDGICKKFDDGV